MVPYILRRLLTMIPVLIIVSGITFILMHAAPGGPWDRDPGARQVDANTQKLLTEYYGLDKDPFFQWTTYTFFGENKDGKVVCGAICGNLGPSYRQRGMTIQQILFAPPEGRPWYYSRFGYSLRLAFLAMSVAILIGMPMGILSALKQNTGWDYVAMFISTLGVSIPSFVVAIFLIILFNELDLITIVPKSWDSLDVWVLPAFVLGFGTLSRTARLTRASMLEVIRQDYIRTARSKGLAEGTVITRHMIKNALIPVVTILGPNLAGLITGSFIIETMFSFPGMGRAYVTAIGQRDYSMIMGTTLVFAILISLANISVDIVYGFIDPRIRID